MLKLSTFITILSLPLLLLFSGCLKDDCKQTYYWDVYTPVYQLVDSLRNAVQVAPPRAVKNPGKIYTLGPILLINELNEGIHIFNNQNPTNPVALSFLVIPGNVDMAYTNGALYADSYMDLLVFDFSTPMQPVLVDRKENVYNLYKINEGMVVVEYKNTEEKFQTDCRSNFRGGFLEQAGGDAKFYTISNASGSPNILSVPTATGTGGSMARFTITNNHLYVVDKSNLYAFDISQPLQPSNPSKTEISWDIETIYPFKDRLFIGSESGMYIYDITTPQQPKQISVFQHARACDPVVADDNTAYVTLRDGTQCRGFINQLDVIDITNLASPKLIKSYPMTHPMGLAIRDQYLFLCDDKDGLKIFDRTDPLRIDQSMIKKLTGFATFDVIAMPKDGHVFVVGKDGLYQFDASNPNDPVLLSVIPTL